MTYFKLIFGVKQPRQPFHIFETYSVSVKCCHWRRRPLKWDTLSMFFTGQYTLWLPLAVRTCCRIEESTLCCGLEHIDGVKTTLLWVRLRLNMSYTTQGCFSTPSSRSQWGLPYWKSLNNFKLWQATSPCSHQNEQISLRWWLSAEENGGLSVERIKQGTCCWGVAHAVMWGTGRHCQEWVCLCHET